jgi:hypothetical protein
MENYTFETGSDVADSLLDWGRYSVISECAKFADSCEDSRDVQFACELSQIWNSL